MRCKICKDEGWVCEDHPNVPWNDGDGHFYKAETMSGKRNFKCEAAGKPCLCNTASPPWHYRKPEETK